MLRQEKNPKIKTWGASTFKAKKGQQREQEATQRVKRKSKE